MALKKSIVKMVYGVEVAFNEAYIEVVSIDGKTDIGIGISIFSNSTKKVVLNRSREYFKPDFTSTNFIAQAYEYLKTLDEYSDAVDC